MVFGNDNRLLAFYPATIGSTARRAPSGSFRVETIVRNPTHTYRPSLHFASQHAKKPVTVRLGPNNPVGLVWIGLSAKAWLTRIPIATPASAAAEATVDGVVQRLP
jgi:lipoprotein-anchoring transpeptidase ErfK/SrfK